MYHKPFLSLIFRCNYGPLEEELTKINDPKAIVSVSQLTGLLGDLCRADGCNGKIIDVKHSTISE